MSFKPTMHGPQKSDGLVVPTKSPNKAATAATEAVEGRSPAKGNTNQQNALRTQSRDVRAPSALDRVREVARTDKEAKFTALLHHVTEERLRSAFFELKK
jgi:RNA-directed DNA polymerase